MQYLTTQEVHTLHNKLIAIYWGLQGDKNIGQLDSVLSHIQNNELYPTIIEKITHMFFSITMFHCFNDGNKRTAIVSCWYFLEKNNYIIKDFASKMEDIAIWVAQWVIKKDALRDIFISMLLSFGYKI